MHVLSQNLYFLGLQAHLVSKYFSFLFSFVCLFFSMSTFTYLEAVVTFFFFFSGSFQVVQMLLKLLEDKNGEVQNLAVKW